MIEKEHLALTRSLAPECTVLLRSNGDFPLGAPCALALYGSGARRTVPGGTGSGEVNSRRNVTCEEGLRAAGFTITTAGWLYAYDKVRERAHRSFVREVKLRALKNGRNPVTEGMGAIMTEPDYDIPMVAPGDVAIYVLARTSGEGADRRPIPGDILLTKTEIHDIRYLNRRYKKFLLVLNVGGPVDLSPLGDIPNILLLSQLGSVTGTVLADLVLGKSYPSGKLTTTWAAWDDYCKVGEFGGRDETRYREGVYVGYRYFASQGVKPLFPFGFGLNYTDEVVFSPAIVGMRGNIVGMMASVVNRGEHPCREVLQFYVRLPRGKIDKPRMVLAAYKKSPELLPEETGKEAAFVLAQFEFTSLASYDAANARYVLEAGDYLVSVGTSSVNTRPSAIIRLPRDVVVLKTRNVCGTPDFTDWHPEPREDEMEEKLPPNVHVIEADPEALEGREVNYDLEHPVDPLVEELTDEELCLLSIGAFKDTSGLQAVIGSASGAVAGAAGETTGALKGRHVPSLVMADGPAGLRLCPKFYRDGEGAHPAVNAQISGLNEFMPGFVRLLGKLGAKKPPEGAVIEEQYATSIPIGTAIAQSWNTELAEKLGDMVGEEMERFGVNLWLAPALNIHRDIRCGRNFEYYSEDPLVTGLTAAAITRGVQSHAGRGVTIKHFACNNQEYNRYYSNSGVSERALREIYLRGFEICVREAQPQAVMTSYNLINGVHASEDRDLLEDVLRAEFGFEGVVMTDWVMNYDMSVRGSLHRNALSPGVAAAGGDLFMPGSRADYERLLAALNSGAVTHKQLKENATRILRLIRKDTEPREETSETPETAEAADKA